MKESISRRNFIRSSAAMGAGMLLSQKAFAAGAAPQSKDAINIGLIDTTPLTDVIVIIVSQFKGYIIEK